MKDINSIKPIKDLKLFVKNIETQNKSIQIKKKKEEDLKPENIIQKH